MGSYDLGDVHDFFLDDFSCFSNPQFFAEVAVEHSKKWLHLLIYIKWYCNKIDIYNPILFL